MKKLYEESSVQDIAAAIREKTGGASWQLRLCVYDPNNTAEFTIEAL